MTEKYHDETYLRLIKHILNNGEQKGDRTGTGTISVFGYQMRFDLSDMSIPLLTTKKMFTRGIIHEILWYLQGNTSSNDLENINVNIWKEWKDKRGSVGPLYGQMWRSFPPAVEYAPIPKRTIEIDDTTTKTWIENDIPNLPKGKHSGKVFLNKEGLEYTVIGVDGNNISKVKTYSVRFTESGWLKQGLLSTKVCHGKFSDQSQPSLYGVGILGDYKKKNETDVNKNLRKTWECMISRCYNKNDRHYHLYGGDGVSVCNRWHVLSDFIKEAKQLPNWFEKKQGDNYTMDKDYFGFNKIYHPETCSWVLKKHNNQHQRRSIPVKVYNDYRLFFFPTVSEAANFLNCCDGTIHDRLTKKSTKAINGFCIEKFTDENYVIRSTSHIDQIQNVIERLKKDPDDRRLIINAWHAGYLPIPGISPSENASLGRQSLPPCHSFIQFWANSGKLKCQLYQRSCDAFLGVPFNIVQYSILTHMIAQVTGHEAAEFIWTGGDVHLYNNHLDQAKEQINRYPYLSPTLELNSGVKEIDNFVFDDFVIKDYTSHSAIKAEVSI